MTYLMADPDIEHVLNVTGSSPRVAPIRPTVSSPVILKPWNERKTERMEEVMQRISEELSAIPKAKVYLVDAGHHSRARIIWRL